MMKLICLIASHINSIQRIDHFMKLLDSIDNQTMKVDVYISLSHDKKICGQNLNNLVHRLRTTHTLYLHEYPKKQFEHYTYLTSVINLPDHSWVIFSDDDDFWHPERVQSYAYAIEQAVLYNFMSDKIIFRTVRSLTRTERPNLEIDRIDEKSLGEYFDSAVLLQDLKFFISNLTRDQRIHPYCDVLFNQYIFVRCGGGKNKVICFEATNYMYYYRDDNRYHHNARALNNDKSKITRKDVIKNNMDLYMAHNASNPTAKGFVDVMSKSGLDPLWLRRAVKYYMENFQKHLFSPDNTKQFWNKE